MTGAPSRRTTTSMLLIATTTVVALSGCTASAEYEGALPSVRATTAVGRSCPAPGDLGSLSAVPFSSVSAEETTCTYRTGGDVAPVSVTIDYRASGAAPGVEQLADIRKRFEKDDETTRDLNAFSSDAFYVVRSPDRCAAWVYADGGLITSVTAVRSGDSSVSTCDLAKDSATVMGTDSESARPIVDVVAPEGLLDRADLEHLDLESRARVRLVPRSGTGYRDASGVSFGTAAAGVDQTAAAVVFVGGVSADEGDRLDLLRAATEAYSRASATAPQARLIVVGPLRSADSAAGGIARSSSDLRSAARIARAVYIDPSAVDTTVTESTANGQLDSALSRTGRAIRNRVLS